MPLFLKSAFLLLDIAPMSWTGLFLVPVLIIALIVVAAAVLIQTLKKNRRGRNAAQTEQKQAPAAAPERVRNDSQKDE